MPTAAARESDTAAPDRAGRYEGGMVGLPGVLDAERTQLQAEDQLAQSRTDAATSLIAVYKALGGGWQAAPLPWLTLRPRFTARRVDADERYRSGRPGLRPPGSPAPSPSPCAEELTPDQRIAAAAGEPARGLGKASRMLLEAADVMGAIPGVLRLIGEAAGVDRVNLMIARRGPERRAAAGRRRASGRRRACRRLSGRSDGAALRRAPVRPPSCRELRAGRSVLPQSRATQPVGGVSITGFEGIGTKTKAIVPIFVDGEFFGIVGFDNTRQRRAIDSAELAALETAAGVIGAGLHRERLIDDVRREREQAAEERMAELAKANAVIRGNLERLASEPDLHSFLGHVLLEATRQFDAASGDVIVSQGHACRSGASPPTCETAGRGAAVAHRELPLDGSSFGEQLRPPTSRCSATVEHESDGSSGRACWPSTARKATPAGSSIPLRLRRPQRRLHHPALPPQRGRRCSAASCWWPWRSRRRSPSQLTRLAHSAKEAAVLVERNRIGQEIHDGLAQAFTGILMQLGAAEEFPPCKKQDAGQALMPDAHPRSGARGPRGGAPLGHGAAARPDAPRGPGAGAAPAGRALDRAGRRRRAASRAAAGHRPEARARARAAAHCAGSGQQRRAPCAIPSMCASRMADEPAHWVLAVADDGRGMEQRAGALRAAGLRAHQHARARRGDRRRVADREPAGRRARASACGCRSAGGSVMVAGTDDRKKIRVILADDHPVVRDGLAAMVNRQPDMEVVAEAGDGEEAIELYEQHQPDVMVLDLRMPKRDGVAVVQRVLEINPQARLLIMTTYDGDEDIFQCLSQGAKGYLLKDAPRRRSSRRSAP